MDFKQIGNKLVSNKKSLYITLGIIVAAIISFFVFFRLRKKKSDKKDNKKYYTPPVKEEVSEPKIESKEEIIDSPKLEISSNKTDLEKPSIRELIENEEYDWEKANDAFSLKLGSRGPRVKALNLFLSYHILNATPSEEELAMHVYKSDDKFTFDTEKAVLSLKGANYISKKNFKALNLDGKID